MRRGGTPRLRRALRSLPLNSEIATGDIPLTRLPFDSLAISTYTYNCVLGMAERDAAIGMLAGLLGEQRTVGANNTNQRYFVRLRLFDPKNFFTMYYGRSKSR
jgi:hypothetical protein